ncbi:MAG: undecaprenyl-diphosphate phosphatase [Treponema sp.]|nr:undecaprenyl-diphosphate phosphatase [Treponema sp.]
MSIFEALMLGVVQGITEFLPVSSSGHLVLLQRIFGITEPAMAFNIAVHVGTLAAVLVVLWQDIWGLLKRIVQPLTLFAIIGTLPAVVIALLFKDHIEKAFGGSETLGFAFLVTSVLLIASDKLYRGGKKLNTPAVPRPQSAMTWKDALFIGILQAVAIIPGVSRSGATISAALSRRLDRDFAARFSFLLSIPAILGGLVLYLKDFIKAAGAPAGEGAISLLPILVGCISAGIVGFFSIRFTIKIVRERSLTGFAVYTAIVGVLVIIDQFGTNFIF